MKKILYKYGYLGVLMLLLSLLSSCKDDDITSPGGNANANTVIELSRINAFFDLRLPKNSSWEIVYHPEWAGPIKSKGEANEAITFFAETNEEDEDRTDKITVAMGDGTDVEFTIKQFGVLNDDSNGAITDKNMLKKTYGVGYGINAFGSPIGASKYDIKFYTPFKMDNLISALSSAEESDGLFMDNNYYSRTESVTGSSTESLANQLSINASMEVGVSAFRLSINGGFSQSSSSKEEFSYAIEEIQHIIGTCYVNAGMLRYFAESGKTDIFQSTFLRYYNKLKENPNDKRTMKDLVGKYGTHIITQGILGGELKLSMQMKITEDLKSTDIQAGLELGSKVINASGDFKLEGKNKSIANNTTMSLVTYGGNNVYSIAPGTTFESFQEQVKDSEKLSAWVESIKDGTSLALIDLQTIPIYELMPTQEAKDALREYIVGDYQKEIYSRQDENYKGPDLFRITGFDVFDNSAEFTTLSRIYIPSIDLEVVAKREKIKEIDNSGYIITLYSGTKNNVNYKSGFFIGNENHKPCKFKYTETGIEKEEFELLGNGALTEFYADATGNITISPKGVTDYYQDVRFEEPEFEYIDLKDITGDNVTFKENVSLTGTAECKITLEEGVSVNLFGTDILKIECKGNNIINIESNNNNSGIIASGNLTINGNGYLISDGSISGSNTGTLNINSGKICVYSIYDAICKFDEIRINGGNVIAKSTLSAAISANTVFVSKNVSQVYAEIRAFSTKKPIEGRQYFEDGSKVVMRRLY